MITQRRTLTMLVSVAFAMAAYAFVNAQATVSPVNDRPNPYRRVHPWGELPAGTSAWAAVIGAEPGPDGNLYVMHRCFENSCAGRPEPPVLKLDRSGRLLASWGAGMFIFPHGFHVDRDGNVWATDARAREGKGSQVFKFDSIEDVESTADDNSGAEGVGVDKDGNVYGAVVRRRMLEKHVKTSPSQ